MLGLGPYYQVNYIDNKQQSIKESTYLKAMEPSTLQTSLRSLVPHKGAGGYRAISPDICNCDFGG